MGDRNPERICDLALFQTERGAGLTNVEHARADDPDTGVEARNLASARCRRHGAHRRGRVRSLRASRASRRRGGSRPRASSTRRETRHRRTTDPPPDGRAPRSTRFARPNHRRGRWRPTRAASPARSRPVPERRVRCESVRCSASRRKDIAVRMCISVIAQRIHAILLTILRPALSILRRTADRPAPADSRHPCST